MNALTVHAQPKGALMSAQSNCTLEWPFFEADYWTSVQGILGVSKGRHRVYFVAPTTLGCGPGAWVLRHYYRGGWIGRFNRDWFLGTSIEASRPYKELSLLAQMRALGLPVPRPIGGRVSLTWGGYRADLLIERIPDTQTLTQRLRHSPLSSIDWQSLGHQIRRFHDCGINHTDLNTHNILIDAQGNFWLIDFDKCDQRPCGAWQQDNLNRLARSLSKEKALAQKQGLAWHSDAPTDWANLLAGYQKRSG